jgi:murein DD-endopeptidase MepM/ murein hydrolase activator NlpD
VTPPPPRRPRAGIRRDGELRRIESRDVRYPGHALPPGVTGEGDVPSGPGLRPARDTGLAVEGRLAREGRARARRQRRNAVTALAIAGVVVAALTGWRLNSDQRASTEPLGGRSAAATTTAVRRASAPGIEFPRMRPATTVQPTPVFATYKDLRMHLPVTVAALTEVGFHQASYTYARHLDTPLTQAKMSKVRKKRSSGRDKASQPTGPDVDLVGSYLTMWRARPGKPDSAVDVGADAGSDVFSPVSGTVVRIKRYKLYGTYDDYEIHIIPDGTDDLDCVLIHVTDLSVKRADHVEAGITRIAAVRKLPRSVGPQLRQFTKNGGYHVHMQLNDSDDPKYRGLEGAISVEDAARERASGQQPAR